MEASATNADNIKERLLSYLGDITKHLDAVLLSSAPLPEAIRMVCVFCGILVKYCSRMLYSSVSQCLVVLICVSIWDFSMTTGACYLDCSTEFSPNERK